MTEPIISADLIHKMQPVRLIAKLPDSTNCIALTADTSGRLILGLNAGDIQIGAVEIKDHDSELRLEVGADGEDIGSAAQVAAFKDTLGKIQRALVDGSGHLQIDVLSSALPTGAATELTLDAVKTAAEVLAAWDETNRAATNPIVGQSGVAAGLGDVDAKTQRVVHGTGDPGVARLINLDTKEGTTGEAADVDGTRAGQLRYIGEAAESIRALADLIEDAVGTPAAAAPSKAIQVGGKYEAVPTSVTDGQLKQALMDALGRFLNPSYSGVAGADQGIDVAPDAAQGNTIPVRASAALSAAGAEDVSGDIPVVSRAAFFDLTCTYTRGAVGGSPRIRVMLGKTVSGVTTWDSETQIEVGPLAEGSDADVVHQAVRHVLPSTSTAAESTTIQIPLQGADLVRVYSRELGVTATPGTLAIVGAFTNRPAPSPVQGDSKAYVQAGDYRRVGETDPLNMQQIPENLADDTNLAASTIYRYSTLGQDLLGTAHYSVTGALTDADGTVTIWAEVTNDEDEASANWKQIFVWDAGNDASVNQFTVTNGTLVFAFTLHPGARWKRLRLAIYTSGATNIVIAKGWRSAL